MTVFFLLCSATFNFRFHLRHSNNDTITPFQIFCRNFIVFVREIFHPESNDYVALKASKMINRFACRFQSEDSSVWFVRC